jgi:glycosyltransferase involved in cell wall biosynthesis
MRILLVGNYKPDHQHSMLRFCELLQCGLQNAGHDVKLIRPNVTVGRFAATERRLGKWLRYVDKFVMFPARLKKFTKSTDVVHICDQANVIYAKWLKAVPHVVTCHDLFAARCALGEIPGFRVAWSGRIYQRMILDGLAQPGHIACVSAATRCDVLRLSKVALSSTSVVHTALNFPYHPASEAEKISRLRRLGISEGTRFILHVGAALPYKNHNGVIRIFRHLADRVQQRDFGLVMVSDRPLPSLKKFVEQYRLRVLVVTCLEPEDLRALYSSATALLFPSLHEGFGWPIIEAQACGCPVFTSNRPPMMTEIGGDGAVYIDPENFEHAADTIFKNLPQASRMREAGFVNVARFSAERMIAGYVNAYTAAKNSFQQNGKTAAEVISSEI